MLARQQRTDSTCTYTFATQHDARRLGTELCAQASGHDHAVAGGQTRHDTAAQLCMNLAPRVVAAEFEHFFGAFQAWIIWEGTEL